MSECTSHKWHNGEGDCLYCEIAELEAENTAHIRRWTYAEREVKRLREAGQAVVGSEMDARRLQATHWHNPTIDALAALQESRDV